MITAIAEMNARAATAGQLANAVSFKTNIHFESVAMKSLPRVAQPAFLHVWFFVLHPWQDPHLRRKALQMFTRRLDPEGGTLRLTPGEESLFVDMVPSLRSVAMGKKATDASLAPEDELDGGLEEVRSSLLTLFTFFRLRTLVLCVLWLVHSKRMSPRCGCQG